MEPQKNILLVVPSLGIGGQEKIAVNTAACLAKVYRTDMVIFQSKDKEYTAPCHVTNLNIPSSGSSVKRILHQFLRATALAKYCRANAVDCTLSFGATANLTNVLSGLFSCRKVVIAIHGFAELKKGSIEKFMYNRADRVICISQEMQYQLLKMYPGLKNTVVIENGYDAVDRVKENGHAPKEICADHPRFVAMGRLEPVKRFDRMLRAFSAVCDQIPRAELSILGEGSLETELKRLCAELGVADRVHFLGYREDPCEELIKNDVFLLTSQTEGFPNSLIEALACRLCVVSVDCRSGPREILSQDYDPTPVTGIKTEQYGVLVEDCEEERFVRLFSEALLGLWRDPAQMDQYRRIARDRAAVYSLERYRSKLVQLFDGIGL